MGMVASSFDSILAIIGLIIGGIFASLGAANSSGDGKKWSIISAVVNFAVVVLMLILIIIMTV